jgi:hypothetical protein
MAMEELWRDGGLRRVADWFERVRSRPAFAPALVGWMPAELTAEMRTNGARSWVAALLSL